MLEPVAQPIHRSPLRRKCGELYYGTKRKLFWVKKRRYFAQTQADNTLEYPYFCHQTPLLRKLKDVDMWLQHNKITNLKLAAAKIDGILMSVLRTEHPITVWKLNPVADYSTCSNLLR